MKPAHPYIVLAPGMRANPTPTRHAVVHVDEWLHVVLGEKDGYVYAAEFDDYKSAAAERERRNHRPGVCITKPAAQPLSEALQENVA